MSDKESCCSVTSGAKSSLLVSIFCCAILFILVVGYVGKIQAVAAENAARIEMLQQRMDQLTSQVADIQKTLTPTAPQASEQPAEPGAAMAVPAPEAAAPAPAPSAAEPAMPETAVPAAPAAPAASAPATTTP